MLTVRPIEVFLAQFIIYLGVWLYDDYIGAFISIVMAGIFTAVLVVSLIVEWIEPSKVPRSYFYGIGLSIMAPLITMALYLLVTGGRVEWLVE